MKLCIAARKHYVYSEDEDEDDTTMKRSSSRTAGKRASVEPSPPVSRSRTTRNSDSVTHGDNGTHERELNNTRRSADYGNLRSRRSDTSSKENRCFDESVKQVSLCVLLDEFTWLTF
jgi:hypothetical protein